NAVNKVITPHECRMRDLTYSGSIYVDIEYLRGGHVIRRRGVPIGKLPLMLRSARCVLSGQSDAQLAKMLECPLDPGRLPLPRGARRRRRLQPAQADILWSRGPRR